MQQGIRDVPLILFLGGVLFLFSCKSKTSTGSDPYSIAGMHAMDSGILLELVEEIENGTFGEVHSVLILRDDELVFEEYFNGYSRDQLHPLYSVTKSFISALIGIAIDEGLIENVLVKMMDFFPEYADIVNGDTLKNAITLEHLLMMQAGFKWDEWDVPYSHPENDIAAMVGVHDWIRYVLQLPMIHAPGTRFAYNSGVSMILSAILTKSTELSASNFAAWHLFNFLDISDWTWSTYQTTMNIGGWGLSLRPLDMVKFGQLFLHNGNWQGRQIISEDWVRDSIQPRGYVSDWSRYGYHWWSYSDRFVEAGFMEQRDVFFGAGRGGQYIWVIPHLDMVVVSTAWNDNNGFDSESMLWEYIIPAVIN